MTSMVDPVSQNHLSQPSVQVLGGTAHPLFYATGGHGSAGCHQDHVVMADHRILVNNIQGGYAYAATNYNSIFSNVVSNSNSSNSESELAKNAAGVSRGGLSLGSPYLLGITDNNATMSSGPRAELQQDYFRRSKEEEEVKVEVVAEAASSSDNSSRRSHLFNPWNPQGHREEDDQDRAAAGSWLQLRLSSSTTATTHPTVVDDASAATPDQTRLGQSTSHAPGFRHLDLHLGPANNHNHVNVTTLLTPNSHQLPYDQQIGNQMGSSSGLIISSILHHHHHHHHHHRQTKASPFLAAGGSSLSVSPSASSSSASFMPNQPGIEGARPSSDFIIIEPPPRRPHSGIWFMLQPSQYQAREPYLPRLSRSFLRIKDGRMTVRLVMKYVANKLGLESESEVEIKCGEQQLVPFLTLQHVRDRIWSPRDVDVATFALPPNSSTSPHVMLLHYGRSRTESKFLLPGSVPN